MTDVNASHVSDDDYAAAKEFFSDKDLVDLTYAIAAINAWNRIGIAFRAEWLSTAQASIGEIAPFPSSELGEMESEDDLAEEMEAGEETEDE